MNAESIIMLLISAGLMVYLLYALLRPENFEMTTNGWIQIFVFLALILAITKPLGVYMTRVFSGERTFLDFVLRPMERLLYRVTGVDEKHEMRWTEYAYAMLLFSGATMLLLYGIERVQQWLPLNPQSSVPSPRHWLLTRRRLSQLTPTGRIIQASQP